MTEYQIVELPEKRIIGLCAQTGNNDPKMQEIIGGLWKQLFEPELFMGFEKKTDGKSIGLYSDYCEDRYDITVGFEVASGEPGKGLTEKRIPGGKYAEFVVPGGGIEQVGKLWSEIWQLPLERTYTGDFEEYIQVSEGKFGEIRIYVAIK